MSTDKDDTDRGPGADAAEDNERQGPPGDGIDRRTWLQSAGAMAGAGLLVGGAAGACDAGPVASFEPVRGDGTHPYHYIDTVVIVQMENRSFDHYFGAYSLVEGRTDIDGLTAGIVNPSSQGPVSPAHLSGEWIIDPDPHHGHSSSLDQWNSGANDGFVTDWETQLSGADLQNKLDWVMGYHTRDDIPVLYTLADNFTLCDRWFCSLLGPTWPNRHYSHVASSGGAWSNLNYYAGPTLYKQMLDRGITFSVYHNTIIYFVMTLQEILPQRDYPAYELEQFFEDAANGTLTNVVVVEPDYSFNDDHPPHDIRLGQSFLSSVYEALRQSPQWDRCLMLVFYDEHGGFHDHVAPPKVQGETLAAQGFDQLGFRVPGIVAGGLARRGHVFSDVIDHTSVPSLLSNLFELPHLNERSRLAGDISPALDIEMIDPARRPDPPPAPMLNLSMARMRETYRYPFGQPELAEFAKRRFGIELPTYDENLRRLDKYLTALDRLKVARVR